MMAMRVLLAFALLSGIASAQESVTVLRGSVVVEAANFTRKIAQLAADRANKGSDIRFRTLQSTAGVAADLAAATATNPVDFGVGVGPLSSPSLPGGTINLPIAWHTVSIYINMLGGTRTLNLTACLAAKIFSGATTKWSAPEVSDANPALKLITNADTTIKVITLPATSGATIALNAWLSTCSGSWSGTFATAANSVLYLTDVSNLLSHTPYAIGYTLTSVGTAAGMPEAALATGSSATSFVRAVDLNTTTTVAAITAQLPSSFTASLAGVNTINMAGTGVFPIVQVDYLYLPTNVASMSEGGALLQATAAIALSADGQSAASAYGLMPFGNGSAAATVGSTTISGMTLAASVTKYTLEPLGTALATGGSTQAVESANRAPLNSYVLADLQQQVATLQSKINRQLPRLLRGSGSSALSAVMWKLLDQFASMSSNPIWTSYRAAGSGTGESEIVGVAPSFTPYVNFGCSDVPMTKAAFQNLQNAGIKVIQIPVAVSPMNFFVNLPSDIMSSLGGNLKLSGCTAAKIFTGAITTWDAADIAADNPGSKLPAKKITFFYRAGSSGTTAVITAYLYAVCPSVWTQPSSKTYPTTYASAGNSTANTNTMITALSANPWSIGYAETGIGLAAANITETAMKNQNGKFITSRAADIPAAASQLFQSGGWPSDPTADFTAVSIVNQPGDNTWPVASLPFMFVRTDLVADGESGALLVAFLSYMLQPSTQAAMTQLGLQPLPTDIITYTTTRAVPLLMQAMTAPTWFYELTATSPRGAGDFVITDPSLKTSYIMSDILSLNAVVNVSGGASGSGSNINVTALLANVTNTNVPADLVNQLNSMNDDIAKARALAAAGVAFGIAGVLLAIFASCRVFVLSASSVFPGQAGLQSLMGAGGSSLRSKTSFTKDTGPPLPITNGSSPLRGTSGDLLEKQLIASLPPAPPPAQSAV